MDSLKLLSQFVGFTGNLEQEAKKSDVLALASLSRLIASSTGNSRKIDGVDDPQVTHQSVAVENAV